MTHTQNRLHRKVFRGIVAFPVAVVVVVAAVFPDDVAAVLSAHVLHLNVVVQKETNKTKIKLFKKNYTANKRSV